MNSLLTRSATGLVFGAVMIGAALLGQQAAAILFFIVSYLGQKEFYSLLKSAGYNPDAKLGLTIGASVSFIIILVATHHLELKFVLLILPLIFILFISELWRKSEKPFTQLALTLTGIIYITIPISMLVALFNNKASGIGHYGMYLGFLIILWVNDTFAYFSGSLFGKHKLFERISPKKTWEGSAGGAIFAIAAANILSLFIPQFNLTTWTIVALIIIITGTLGDLVESLFKRSLGVKDSGTILPGHGGILDRFDALLLSVPFVYAYLTLFAV